MSKLDQTEDNDLEEDESFDDKDDAVDSDDDLVDEKVSVADIPVKINKEARKKLEELLEQKRLRKMIEDDFFGTDID